LNQFDLWELTTLYQEVHGSCYWLLDDDALGMPQRIWVLPTQNVTPRRRPNSHHIVDYYEYRVGSQVETFPADTVIHFRYPDPRDPYTSGLSPLRAAFEQVSLASEYHAFRRAVWENSALPSAVVSPEDVLGEEERDRLEAEWNQKYRRGGAGRILVAESAMRGSVLTHSVGDLAALAEDGGTQGGIAHASHLPPSCLTTETNLATLEAAEHQHMSLAIAPRLRRRDEKINQQLLPKFDPSGRLFVASDDPIPANAAFGVQQQEIDLRCGVVT